MSHLNRICENPWPPEIPGLKAIGDAIAAGDTVLASGLASLLLLQDLPDELPAIFDADVVRDVLELVRDGDFDRAKDLMIKHETGGLYP